MDTNYYLNKFQKSTDLLDKAAFSDKQLNLKVGVWRDSVVLKIQKKEWLDQNSANPFGESVFFSVWVSDDTIAENKFYYNIHALKMRELTGYKIKSRDFAEAFRKKFKKYTEDWPNVKSEFGPLTLMEGWVDLDNDHLQHIIKDLATRFLNIQYIIDELLEERKR